MPLELSRDMLRAAYNFLCETTPFCKWNLPDGEDVKFRVVRDRTCEGWHVFESGKHTIAISSSAIGHTDSLMAVMAHEMVHVHERHAGACKSGVAHSAAFHRWSAEVCAIHGFDPKIFCM